jgi:Mg-chelatase subunit ChlD
MSAMHNVFAAPWVLWLALLFPILTMAQLLLAWRKRRLLARVGTPLAMVGLLPPRPQFRWLTGLATTTAFTLLLAAAAAPHWGREEHPEVVAGRDIVILLDMSNSMRASDAPPSRFDRARQAVMDLLDAVQQRGGHRLALVVFAADAQIICPLTHDYNHIRAKVQTLDLDQLPQALRMASGSKSGTRIGAGLRAAMTAHDPAFRGFQDVVLLSDGDDPVDDGEWQNGLTRIREAEIPVSAVGIGDPEHDSEIALAARKARTRLRERPLREIARQTGGHYLAARLEPPRLGDFFRQRIESKGGTTPDGDTPPLPRPRQAWFYAGALALFAVGWLTRTL